MSDNPYDRAHELARAIKDSETYQQYLQAQKELEKYPEAKEKIIRFRTLQMEINQAHILGQTPDNEKVQQATVEYAKLNREKHIADFLKAEGMFMQMFQDIQEIIQKHLESGFIH